MLIPETGVAPIASLTGRNICTPIFQRIKRVEKLEAVSSEAVALRSTVPGISIPARLSSVKWSRDDAGVIVILRAGICLKNPPLVSFGFSKTAYCRARILRRRLLRMTNS